MAFSFTCSTTRLITLPVGRETLEDEEVDGRGAAVARGMLELALRLGAGRAAGRDAVERFAGERFTAGRFAARAGAALRAAGRRLALLRAALELLRAAVRFGAALRAVAPRLAEDFLAAARFAAGRRAEDFFAEDLRAAGRFFEDFFDEDFLDGADFFLADFEDFFEDLRLDDFFDDDFLDVFREAAIRFLLFQNLVEASLGFSQPRAAAWQLRCTNLNVDQHVANVTYEASLVRPDRSSRIRDDADLLP